MTNQTKAKEVLGEGNITAARRYNEAAQEHAQRADVEAEADAARPRSDAEAKELKQAEDAGRARAKDEDPLLDAPEKIKSGEADSTGR